MTDFLARAAAAGVTHISGTPSHWRRALMSGAAATIAPRYVRLSGEIADQAILDNLRAAYPDATVAHAFASTEAGVAFEVRDGQAGFPADALGAPGAVELRVAEETLQIRSAGTALRYLGEGVEPLRGADGFVDTGDRIEEQRGALLFHGPPRRGDQRRRPQGASGRGRGGDQCTSVGAHVAGAGAAQRHHRRGRHRGGGVGGGVTGRGDAVRPPTCSPASSPSAAVARLAPHKVPAMIRIVPALEVSASGKLVRPVA